MPASPAAMMLITALSVAGSQPAPSENDDTLVSCSSWGLTQMHDMMLIKDAIARSQDEIRSSGTLGCIDGEGQRLWLRRNGNAFELDHMYATGGMLF